jgi:enamine deaminase RidA (YjgF/YER057c/UK114 family)
MEGSEEDSVAQGDMSYRASLSAYHRDRSVSRKGTQWRVKREKIQPQGIHVSMVDGKTRTRYTHVVTVSGTGKMIFVAGQLARKAQGVCVGKGDFIKTCLEAVGATLADIVISPAPSVSRGRLRG